jgi:hypothetical protein
VFRVRIDVEAIAPKLAFSPIAKPIAQMIGIGEQSFDCLAMFMSSIKYALCFASACHASHSQMEMRLDATQLNGGKAVRERFS